MSIKHRASFMVLGTSDKPSKVFLTGEVHGMRTVLLCGLKQSANYSLDSTELDYKDIEQIYIAIHFAKKHGLDSLRILIHTLQDALKKWEDEDNTMLAEELKNSLELKEGEKDG